MKTVVGRGRVKKKRRGKGCSRAGDVASWMTRDVHVHVACSDARRNDRCLESFDDATLREVRAEELTEVKMVKMNETIDRRVEEKEDDRPGWLNDDVDAQDSESPKCSKNSQR